MLKVGGLDFRVGYGLYFEFYRVSVKSLMGFGRLQLGVSLIKIGLRSSCHWLKDPED